MIDISKIVDIVLLMIDGNFGFEMETMEFLNILTTSGMPGNVFGILTHLDLFKKPQTLRDVKKRLKNRFWSELYQGAHLFYLSGVINGRYPDREIHNISRFISVMKNPRPLIWRNSHPYALVDSFRDITHPTKIENDPHCDRSIALSGYLRGSNFAAENQRIHIPGLGDFSISLIEAIPDPCSTPHRDQAVAKASGKTGRKRLDERERKLHAPMSDRGGLKIDGDTVWITRNKGFNFDKDAVNVDRGEGEELIINLQNERRLLGETEDGMKLFNNGDIVNKNTDDSETGRKETRSARILHNVDKCLSRAGTSKDFDKDEDIGHEDVSDIIPNDLKHILSNQSDSESSQIIFADSDSELGSISEDDYDSRNSDNEEIPKGNFVIGLENNLSDMSKKPFNASNISKTIYDESLSPVEVIKSWCGEKDKSQNIEVDEEDQFFKFSKNDLESQAEQEVIHDFKKMEAKWTIQANIDALRSRFVTSGLLQNANEDIENIHDEEGDGVFEDLEVEENSRPNIQAERERISRRKEELKLRFETEDREGLNNDRAQALNEGDVSREIGEDDWYEAQKAEIQKQLNINRAECENLEDEQRVMVEGFRAGQYVKFIVEGVVAEFVTNFNPQIPLIIGGLTATEERFGYVQARIKRHRWHKKILKTHDPLIISMGWRRFQTLPVYSISDSRVRSRMLKYTPEHMHCFATFYGPFIAPNTGFSCYRSLSSKESGFRVAAIGTVLNVDEASEIVKKLKLTGTPYKIFKNTAFIKDMFTSSVEIAKFEGALIRTVSGIRGQIKKALSRPEGHFRATFEDKILMSDIVFLRTWYPIRPHRYYNIVTNLIGWTGMRLTGEVRKAEGLKAPQQKDSVYKPIKRVARNFNPLKVPRAIASELPYKSQIVQMKRQKTETYMHKRAVVLGGEEKMVRDLMNKLMTLRKEKVAKRQRAKEASRESYRKKIEKSVEKREERERKENQEYWRKEGKKRKSETDDGGKKKNRR